MTIPIHEPSLVAIYLTESQKNIMETESGKSLIKNFTNRVKTLFPLVPIYSNFPLPHLEVIFFSCSTERQFLLEVSKKLPPSLSEDQDFDEVYLAYFHGVYPLLSIASTKTLLERHKNYLSQYSFSENLPSGIVPTLISREFISTLPDRQEISFHDFLLKNINQYDTEIYFESPDLRNFRLDFTLKDLRSLYLCSNFIKINPEIEYKDILPVLKLNPSFLRSSPTYIELELYRGCELSCSFCPRTTIDKKRDHTFFSESEIKNLLDQLNSYQEDYTICFGGMGEPLLHPKLIQILDIVLEDTHVKELVLETALYPDISSFITYLKGLSDSKKRKLILIVNLTTLKEQIYKDIYGKNLLGSILEKLDLLKVLLDKKNLYVQMLKIKEIETEIEEYFNYFEKLEVQVLLQKYNSYANRMAEKRVSDLTPIQRDFCWHLARDLYIQSNGDVSACKQVEDVLIGNIKKQPIFEIWNQNSRRFENSFNQKHSDIDLPCLKCDEWYTFNA